MGPNEQQAWIEGTGMIYINLMRKLCHLLNAYEFSMDFFRSMDYMPFISNALLCHVPMIIWKYKINMFLLLVSVCE